MTGNPAHYREPRAGSLAKPIHETSLETRINRSSSLELERHPGAPRRQPWRSWATECAKSGPIAVDLFCGAGGLSLGLERAGYTVVLSVDHDPAAVQTHLSNFPGSCLDLDLADPDRVHDLIGLLNGLEVDLIAGGPPCQPFSRAGLSKIRDLVENGGRDPVDSRRELWRVFLTVVEAVRPRAALMENVPDMALGDDMRTVRYMADRLETAGYETDMQILEAWRFGVPQHRQRLFFVALREGTLKWPKESGQVVLRDAIGDLPKLGHGTGERAMRYQRPRTEFQRQARAHVRAEHAHTVFDHMTRAVRDDDRQAFELMAQGLRYQELPAELKRYRDDIFDDKYNRLNWNDLSRSITAHIAKDGYWYIHPEEDRTLTVREAARIQTFPDEFRFSGSRSDAFRLIGNAVPPLLGEVVAKAVRAATARPRPAGQRYPTEIRSEARRLLLEWAARREKPAWRRVGVPWAVLLGTLTGSRRGQATLADRLLGLFPSPLAATPSQVSALARKAKNAREKRAIRAIGRVSRWLQHNTWEVAGWAPVSGLGRADSRWVETVGLGRKHVVAIAGTVRVAGRVLGYPDADGVGGRMLLAQLVGQSEAAPAITAAIAGLAVELCHSAVAHCYECPLSEVCLSAGEPLPAARGQ
jgi:DNA (cytosine-5)-methyltransferase 1